MSAKAIQIRGARVHNLQDLDLDLPLGQLIALSGVSGSGKSSLAFGLLHAEAQRRLLLSLPASVRERLGQIPRPEVDLVHGLPSTVGLPLEEPGPRSVGAEAEVDPLLAALFATAGLVHCPRCDRPLPVDSPRTVPRLAADWAEGTRLWILAPVRRAHVGSIAPLVAEVQRGGFARVRLDGALYRIEELPGVDGRQPHDLEVVVDRIRWSADKADRLVEAVRAAWQAGQGRALLLHEEGGRLQSASDHPWCPEHDLTLPIPTTARLLPDSRGARCEDCGGGGCEACGGSGLGPLLRAIRLGDRHLGELRAGPLLEIEAWLEGLLLRPLAAPLRDEASGRLRRLARLGLGHLPLARPTPGLALGEWSRLRLAGRLTDETRGELILVDEPCSALDEVGVAAVTAELRRLVDQGNTVVVVEHRPSLLRAVDHLVELGPGAGELGGQLIFEGRPDDLARADTPTGRALRAEIEIGALGPAPAACRPLRLRAAPAAGAREIELLLPTQGLVALTGAGGSGRKRLLIDTLGPRISQLLGAAGPPPLPSSALDGAEQIARVVTIDRARVGRSPRSCVVTSLGAWSPIRGLLAATREAKILGLGPGHFSFNRPGGRCEACEGAGVVEVGPTLVADAVQPCEICLGARFDRTILGVRWRGASAADLLAMRVGEAATLLANQRRVGPVLDAVTRVGLGYLPLGQRTDTLSGGELQRLRLAAELARARPRPGEPLPQQGTLILIDRPELGLHEADLAPVVAVLDRLVQAGAVVMVVTDHPRVAGVAHHRVALPTS